MIRFLLILFFISLNGAYAFEDDSCLKSDFSTTVEKGIDPFGYLKEVLTVNKKKCNILVELNKAKYLSSKWNIDICREPIHIKYGNNYQSVVKKSNTNCADHKSDYCDELKDITSILEDNGLIYGEGIREDLSSQHGKIFCAYLLVKQYLKNSVVFSYEKPVAIALNGSTFMQNLDDKGGDPLVNTFEVPRTVKRPVFEKDDKLYDF